MITKFSPMAIQVLEKRYLLKNKEGTIVETPDELLERVAKYVCGEDKKLLAAALKLMKELKFLPNTPTLMNAGTTNMLSACFAIPISDSLESIVHEALWQQAAIHKKGGGTGLNFSSLRPKGDPISSTGGVTCGVLSFMENFDTMSKSIMQGGKRAGANMSILSIYHPEIEEFIKIKTTNHTDYENMNLSVLVDDSFMFVVKNNKDIKLSFPIKSKHEKDIRKVISAKYLWDLICDSAHKCGCPGILFEDTINSNNTLDKHGFHIVATNPCGEQPLFCGEYNGKQIAESCNLGSLNLLKFVKKDNSGMDYKKLEEAVLVAIDFLDRVIDKNVYPFKFIEEGTKLTRKIGLGVTGFSDYLIQIGVPYNSERAIKEAEEIMKFITNKAHLESFDLASEFGKYPLAELIGDKKRNNMCTTIAPTGTIGRLMLGHGYSSGIEPPFAVYMKSNIIETTIDDGIHPLLLDMLKQNLSSLDLEAVIYCIKNDGSSIQDLKVIPEKIRQLFLTSNEIPIEQHIAIQAAFQKYTDNAVSKTINIHNKATVSDVSKAFMLAYDSGCKGTTIYRDGSKNVQVLNSIKETQKIITGELFKELAPRPAILPALSFVKQTACNTLFINPTYMGIIDKSALEHFIDSHGGCLAMRTGLAMSVSLYQRIIEDINPEYARNALQIVTSHLLKVECPVCKMKIKEERHKIKNGETVEEPVDSISCPNALAQVMEYMLKHKVETYIDGVKFKAELYKIKSYEGIEAVDNKKCPDCGTVLIRQEGCTSFQCPKCMTGGCN